MSFSLWPLTKKKVSEVLCNSWKFLRFSACKKEHNASMISNKVRKCLLRDCFVIFRVAKLQISYELWAKSNQKITFLGYSRTHTRELWKLLQRSPSTSRVKSGNFTREVGRLYTLSLPSILALCNRLKLRYVEFRLFSRCVLRISCFRFESMCFRVRWQWGSLHSVPKNIRWMCLSRKNTFLLFCGKAFLLVWILMR